MKTFKTDLGNSCTFRRDRLFLSWVQLFHIFFNFFPVKPRVHFNHKKHKMPNVLKCCKTTLNVVEVYNPSHSVKKNKDGFCNVEKVVLSAHHIWKMFQNVKYSYIITIYSYIITEAWNNFWKWLPTKICVNWILPVLLVDRYIYWFTATKQQQPMYIFSPSGET